MVWQIGLKEERIKETFRVIPVAVVRQIGLSEEGIGLRAMPDK